MSFHAWKNMVNFKSHFVFKDMGITYEYKGATKFLGLCLTEDVKWNVHIEQLSNIEQKLLCNTITKRHYKYKYPEKDVFSSFLFKF
jgi:hypothetical protein